MGTIGPSPLGGPLHAGLVIVDEGLEPLTEDQARGLLATGEVGRVGITIGALPAIFPVNYWLIDWSIVFRTARAARCRPPRGGAVVAFEDRADVSVWWAHRLRPAPVCDLNLSRASPFMRRVR
jgi:hypothetical protein